MTTQKCNLYTRSFIWIAALACAVATANAATLYVAKTGSDSNDGSQAHPWLTVTYAAGRTNPGDTVRVAAGTYDERVKITRSGSSAGWISYVADAGAICRGVDLMTVSYIRVVGFEITHVVAGTSPFTRGVTLSGASSHIEIVDNYIHNTTDGAIWAAGGSTTSYITIRGNRLYYLGYIPGVCSYPGGPIAISGTLFINGGSDSHWLVEYNTAQRSGDFLWLFGDHCIARNNYFHDFADSYWTMPLVNGVATPNHSDMFQCGSDQANAGVQHQLYEANLCGDSAELNSHMFLFQDTMMAGDNDLLVRGNVGFNFGSNVIGVKSTDHVATYNNTFYAILQAGSGNVASFYKTSSSTDYPNYPVFANTIIANLGSSSTQPVYVLPGITGAVVNHNLGYSAGSDPSYISTRDPLFVDPANHNFRIQSTSPARGLGVPLVSVTSASGSGTSFTVNDGKLLNDGFGLTDGDTITVGGTTTRITGISGNTVTVANSVSWTTGAPVYWGAGTTVDLGALPYASAELLSASLVQNASTYTVTPTGDARGVWFYVDGVPTTWVSKPPFTATISSGTVTAKAYALYAQANPVVLALLSGSTPPPPPQTVAPNNVKTGMTIR